MDDYEVKIKLVFHAMADDPIEAIARCASWFDQNTTTSVYPLGASVEVSER